MTDKIPVVAASGKFPGVSPGGMSAPGWEEENTKVHGYACPRDWYIYHSGEMSPSRVSEEWGIPAQTISAWASKGAWLALRKARMQQVSKGIERVYDEEQLALKRQEWIVERIRLANVVISKAEAMLEEGTEEVITPTGLATKKLGPAAIKSLGLAISEQMDNISVALGVPTKLTGQFAGATVDQRKQTLVTMTVAAPAGIPLPLPRSPELDATEANLG